MPSPIEDIKSRLDIVELISSYIRLEKAGSNYRARCPFHTEKTPSFFISPSRQIWHCFGCGKGGDHFKFIMEIEGQDFPETLRLLAQRAGVVLKREDPRIRSERNLLYDICEEATKVFEKNFALTGAVRAYIKKRGVEDKTLKEFRIGFAPQSWDFLIKALGAKGFKAEELEKAGLAIKSPESNSWYDRFRSRIIFPITDANGRVIGFSGRIFEPEALSRKSEAEAAEAKYINTPQTLIYDKSRVLYGFDKAKQDIKAKNQVIVVEGQMDLIMSYQAGVKNVIAVSGTALTPYQLKILRRLCDTIVSSFDADAAGESATRRSLELAAEFEFERKIAVIPSGKDPADAVLEDPESWRKAVAEARPVIEFYFEKAFREKDPKTAGGKKEISAMLLPLIVEVVNEVEKAHWVSELSLRLGVPEEAIWKEIRRGKKNASLPRAYEEKETERPVTRRELLEERLLAIMTMVREELRLREFQNHHIVFASALNRDLFGVLLPAATPAENSPVSVTSDLSAHLKEKLELLRFKGEVLSQITDDIEEEFIAVKRELEKECIKEKLLLLGEEIKRIEQENNPEKLQALLQDFKTLSWRLGTIS
jgi:DNA primase